MDIVQKQKTSKLYSSLLLPVDWTKFDNHHSWTSGNGFALQIRENSWCSEFVNNKHAFKLYQNKENNHLEANAPFLEGRCNIFGIKEVELIQQDTIINTIELHCLDLKLGFTNFLVHFEIQFSNNTNILWCFAGGPWRLAKGGKYWTAMFGRLVAAAPESIPF